MELICTLAKSTYQLEAIYCLFAFGLERKYAVIIQFVFYMYRMS